MFEDFQRTRNVNDDTGSDGGRIGLKEETVDFDALRLMPITAFLCVKLM